MYWFKTFTETLQTYEHRRINVVYFALDEVDTLELKELLSSCEYSLLLQYHRNLLNLNNLAYNNAPENCFTLYLEENLSELHWSRFCTFIERIKDGRFVNGSNRHRRIKTERPHIWVFTPFTPDKWIVSNKWKLWRINKDKELVPYVKNI